MNKILTLLLVLIFLSQREAIACIFMDWKFTLNIGLELDTNKLEKLCSEETCSMDENFIVIKSHYDDRVAVIVGKTHSILGFKGISIRLPYELENETPKISSIDPEEYNWGESVRVDLSFLKQVGVLKIEDKEIEEIAGLASNGKNILPCKEWKALEANCFCDENGEEICLRCGSASTIQASIPKKVLEVREKSNYFATSFQLLQLS
jgi:hypothetical protein